jgi:hypothetical protein
MEEMRKQSAQEESDDDYRPQDDVEEEDNEVEFTADDFEAEEEHDEDREAYLAREIHGARPSIFIAQSSFHNHTSN